MDAYSDSNHLGNAIGHAVSHTICDACAERDADGEPFPECPCAVLTAHPHGHRCAHGHPCPYHCSDSHPHGCAECFFGPDLIPHG